MATLIKNMFILLTPVLEYWSHCLQAHADDLCVLPLPPPPTDLLFLTIERKKERKKERKIEIKVQNKLRLNPSSEHTKKGSLLRMLKSIFRFPK